ncbi:hypothetical protein CDQ84_00345 [Clostridium thermosuccinogenes]|uniref:HMA domain-containing protein n=1 Tax=Clostridium thermosuccinogenes TaxID=84032 RepID=A0A2K2FN02_9CLOT|nr:heavy-metal-associated domain-containing protein [Pseudoclostridium thermosuccinogenes]AUS97872.1 hypothetical protein CDO33_16335 [Pseudoclostridium thermosuccinogenes]PNU00169.1 hypothetical protein CDQ85_00345 [Pseudoclostridium thermosuccinogenes]PNU01493.1 hypothetical protein CDQ84_00345 [Pseudoclostridium thermosuccinogenes]
MKANKFVVAGLTDAAMIPDIKQSISNHVGINAVRVDMHEGTVTVDYDEGRYEEGDIKRFVSEAGLSVREVK